MTPARQQQLDIGYTGHLYPGRGIDVLIEAARRAPWLQLHIVGGDPQDVRHWQDIAGAIDNISWYGHVDPVETPAYRERCDALAAPYQEVVKVAGNRVNTSPWMSPLKIFEYMSSRKPMVCSDLPVLREVLEHGRNALLCTPGDVDEWLRAFARLRDDPALGQRLAERAYRDYMDHYTWKRRAQRLLGAFAPPAGS